MEKIHITKGSDNIFEDLGFAAEVAQNLLIRANLMISIIEWYRGSQMTQVAAAKVLGITQPRLNLILKAEVESFSLDALVNIAAKAGLTVQLLIKPAKLKTAPTATKRAAAMKRPPKAA